MTTNYDNGIYSKAMYDFIARCSYDHYIDVLHRNSLNADYGNDSYQGIFLKLYIPAIETKFRPSITIETSSDNLIDHYEIESSRDCYNRQLLYGNKPSKRGNVHGLVYDYDATNNKQDTWQRDIELDNCFKTKLTVIPNNGQEYNGINNHSIVHSDSELSDFYSKKQAMISKRFAHNINQSEIREYALSDMVIDLLEQKQDVYDEALLQTAYNRNMTDISRKWKALKRPKQTDKVNDIFDDEGNEVDSIELISLNYSGNNADFVKKARKKLSGDLLTVFDGLMEGKKQKEIADEMGLSSRTVIRLKAKVVKSIGFMVNDLIDHISMQNEINNPVCWIKDGNSRTWKEHNESNSPCYKIDLITGEKTIME